MAKKSAPSAGKKKPASKSTPAPTRAHKPSPAPVLPAEDDPPELDPAVIANRLKTRRYYQKHREKILAKRRAASPVLQEAQKLQDAIRQFNRRVNKEVALPELPADVRSLLKTRHPKKWLIHNGLIYLTGTTGYTPEELHIIADAVEKELAFQQQKT